MYMGGRGYVGDVHRGQGGQWLGLWFVHLGKGSLGVAEMQLMREVMVK